jgi:hypothetical protein
MAEASKDTQFSGLGYGDETRKQGDYIGVEHDQQAGGLYDVKPGQAVSTDGSGVLKQYENGDVLLGVLSNYERSGDSGGPSDPAPIDQNQDANVKVSGVAKVEVSNDTGNTIDVANTGLELGVDSTNGVAGVLDAGDDGQAEALSLSGAVEDDRPDGTTAYYAEVRLR